jgi:hypothetical protein
MNYYQIPEYLQSHVRKWSAMQLWIYADVHTMQQNKKRFYKTNAQLAEAFETDERTVRRIINGFVKLGILTVYRDGKQRFLYAKEPHEWKEDSKVRGQQSPGTAKSVKEDSKVPEGGQQSPKKGDSKVLQIEKVNREVNREDNREKGEIILPWDSERFENLWNEWKQDRKERRIKKYTRRGELAALHKLYNQTNGNEDEAIERIELAIANQWQGVVFGKSTGRRSNANGASNLENSVNQQKLAEFARTGRITTDRRDVF